MDDVLIQRVLLKLVGRGALAYAFHAEDKSLSVVDKHGRKFLFCWGDYQHLLPKARPASQRQPARTGELKEVCHDHVG